MKNRNQHGFTTIEILLVLLVVVVLGAAGYLVWNRHSNSKMNRGTFTSSHYRRPNQHPTTLTTNKSTGLSTFTSKVGKFSVSYPASWVQPANQRACGGFLSRDLEIGPNIGSVIKCGGDGTVSQVSVSSVNGDQTKNKDYSLNSNEFGAPQTSSVTTDNVSGTSYRGVASGKGNGSGVLPPGAIVIEDIFYQNQTTYIATYTQYPASSKEGPTQNQLNAFNKIVASLKFE